MKLGLAIAVLLLSGVSLAWPQNKVRQNVRTHYGQLGQLGQLGHYQPVQLRAAAAPALAARTAAPAPPVDTFNFIDLQLLQRSLEVETGNVVLSPASVKTTLSMLFEGADGRSAEEIGQALRLDRLDRRKQEERLHQFQHNLTMRSPGAGNVAAPASGSTLEVASRVFYGEDVLVKQSYADKLHNYNAGVTRVNMSDPQLVAGVVNKWVSEATRQHIPTLVRPESLGEGPMMVLANAVYFQGAWLNAFDPQATGEKCFYPEGSDACLKVPMMETTGAFRSKLIRELDATILELPYDDGRFSMLILLPEQRDGMKTLIRDLDCCGHLLSIANHELEDSEYVVEIPKFAIEYNTDIKPILNKLDIVDIFSASANLSRMLKQDHAGKADPVVSNVLHKAKITVDERGAIAAGVSGALVVPLMGGPQPRFVADHPFLFFIRDMQTGGFLFAGRVSQPHQEGVEEGSNAAYVPYAENAAGVPPPAAPAPVYAPPAPVYVPVHPPASAHGPAHAPAQAAHAGAQQPTTSNTTKRATMPAHANKDTPVINFPSPGSNDRQ